MSNPQRIAIATGGTAGHAVPALAVGEELRARGHEVLFVGGDRAEAQLVPAAGFEFHSLDLAGLDRRNPLRALHALWLAWRGVFAARRILRERGAVAVLAGGGYVAGPVGLAAVLRRQPLVLTEADAHLGLTNRLLAPFARRVCLAFPLSGRDGDRYRVTGRPIAPRREALDKPTARSHFGLPAEGLCLLAFGGSLGAQSVNRATIEAFASGLPDGVCVLHLTGRSGFTPAREQLERSPALRDAAAHARYRLFDYTDDFDLALAAADLAVCRAGGSVFELAASSLPAVLVPFPGATGDHQAANAGWYVDGGAGVMVRDGELTGERLRTLIETLVGDAQRLAGMSSRAHELARPDAAQRIADEVEDALR